MKRRIEYQDMSGKLHKLGVVSGKSEHEIGVKGKEKVDAFKRKRFF